MNKPRVSVVIPTRNRMEKLRRALASVNRQTFRDFDVWIVDDSSTDGTLQYLQQSNLPECFPGIPLINILGNDQSVGAASARNQALDQSDGELIAFLDDDDAWLPDYLKKQVQNLDLHPEASASYAGYTETDRDGKQRRPDLRPLFNYDSPLIHLLTESFIHTLSVFVCRREAFRRIGKLDDSLGIAHDLDWYARLLMDGGIIISVEGAPLVLREMPGGLVTRHHQWFEEEQGVHDRVFRQSRYCVRRKPRIRAHRALVFTRLGIARKDYFFAAGRLFDVLRNAPIWSMRIIFMRLWRNLRPGDQQHESPVNSGSR